ncbi:MAG: tRNA (5-methylaminomethyl-2-thiouridine)(34)-methyltransferase MnmD [Bacteroidota bacterium]
MIDNSRKIITTEDGSHSLYMPELKEQYHSVHGALTESMHVFIHAGLRFSLAGRNTMNILEVGFGTGLNALLTFKYALRNRISVTYFAIEPFPIDSQIISQLNYPDLNELENTTAVFSAMHNAPFNVSSEISEHFLLHKISERLEVYQPPSAFFDLVYFDAFSPAVQPELWTRDVFDIVAKSMKQGAVLVTYCCKGEVKRQLRAAGFEVTKIPGPPGKREMIRAVKSA